ncbi:Chromatin modification-related protein [Venustampulla echinocandica]|uniref:Chromatin modification-related protein n=1 Tax=Venustampulla echinocandica TaxID=2656787 RepID=A0A370U027_9HELO|nr:Chromatin modification-related protein [Venustampulla echinocandica]RDL41129.1 Chromatin modification-related protein [Venustampulla echinocandica]
MKTVKPLSSDLSSSRRAQPIRQTRTNPPRSSIPGARSFPSRGSLSGGQEEKEIEIFPAITHFADAITALPKELMRHFTLLKEVDAKIFAPEDDLGKLVDAALNAPPPERRPPPEIQNNTGPKSIPMSAQGSASGSIVNGHPASVTSVPDADVYNTASAAYDPANIPRRQLFQHCAYTMQNMLVSLDEKNHVISTAAEALNKQLARIDDCFPHVELEISEEARYGSTTHWAYPENRISKLGPSNGSRKDVAPANNSSGAQQLTEDALAKSDARKQALLAKKSHKHHHAESDFDDHHDSRPKDQKKVHGNSKIRKAADASPSVGLGITNGSGLNGNPPKRRKVEKGPSGGVVMERAVSGVSGSNGTATKGKAADWAGGQAPRARQRSIPKTTRPSLGPDSKKKSRGGGTANGPTRKRNNTITSAMSPSLASSPIRSTFPDLKPTGRGSPQPTNGGRPPSSRARQNSTQSIVDNNRQRPDPAASAKLNGNSPNTPDLGAVAPASGRTTLPDVKSSIKEPTSNAKGEPIFNELDKADPGVIDGGIGHRKSSVAKREDADTNGDSISNIQATTVMTKSGRASKPSTPAMSSFPDQPRSRSARSALEHTSNNKRSHKKGAGAAAQIIAQQNLEVDDATSTAQEDDEDEEIGADELTYCYCNGVSYGEMVACDADDCEKEWFHLECVGLKVAPRGNAKWFCNDCKEKIKTKRLNGR